jgi:hypothetical protein
MYRVKTILTAAVLSGLVVLNYGFNNLTIHWNALPLPVGYLLGAAALLSVLWEQRRRLRGWLREPLIWAWLVLIWFSLLRLLWNVPRFGLWAWRDASFVFQGAFLLLGFGWAVTPKDQNRFVHILDSTEKRVIDPPQIHKTLIQLAHVQKKQQTPTTGADQRRSGTARNAKRAANSTLPGGKNERSGGNPETNRALRRPQRFFFCRFRTLPGALVTPPTYPRPGNRLLKICFL